MATRLLRLNPSRALHQNARNDLEAVCDSVLDFLQQDGFVTDEVIFQSSFGADVGYVGDSQKKANMFNIAVIQRPCINDQVPCFLIRPLKVDFISFNIRASGRCSLQQGCKLGHRPFAASKFAEAFTANCSRVDVECPAERCARRNDLQAVGQEKQRFIRGYHHGKGACRFEMHCGGLCHEEALKGRRLTEQVITRQLCQPASKPKSTKNTIARLPRNPVIPNTSSIPFSRTPAEGQNSPRNTQSIVVSCGRTRHASKRNQN